ncbi:acetyltransferase [Cylindrospermum sp. NIES-4074]|nr:acetyltransferase [Cylindrospermum sp. NIES-4074]
MTKLTIKTTMAADEVAVIDVLVLAFSSDPAVRWLYPNPHQYLVHFPAFVKVFGGNAFTQGSAYYVDGYKGAALWFPPDVHPEEEGLIALLQRTVAKENLEDAFEVFEQMGSYHPNEPHWYLPLLGVDPSAQRKGYGSALLQHTLTLCDRDKKLAYLESSNPESVPLYERHGFALLGTIQVGASPPIFPMLRTPR